MTTMTRTRTDLQYGVIGGVDTHRDTHTAAVIDPVGRLLDHRSFLATPAGYRQLLAWLQTFGTVQRIGIEGTGAYGNGLTNYLTSQCMTVIEVDRPERKTRRSAGKSDPIDAEAAARAAASRTRTGTPKNRTGDVRRSETANRLVRRLAVVGASCG